MTYSSFRDYLHAHVGQNWVIARRSPRIVARYGEDVVCLSQARYATLKALYDAQAPSVDNAARAMLAALRTTRVQLAVNMAGKNALADERHLSIVNAAIAQAEAAGVQ